MLPQSLINASFARTSEQYVGSAGQEWIDRRKLQESHKNVLREEEPNMLGIGTEPSFAIGQRALLIQTGRCTHLMRSRSSFNFQAACGCAICFSGGYDDLLLYCPVLLRY